MQEVSYWFVLYVYPNTSRRKSLYELYRYCIYSKLYINIIYIYICKHISTFLVGKKTPLDAAVLRYPGIQHGAGDPWSAMAELVSWDEKVTVELGLCRNAKQPKQNQQRNTLEDERLEPTNHPWIERKMIWTKPPQIRFHVNLPGWNAWKSRRFCGFFGCLKITTWWFWWYCWYWHFVVGFSQLGHRIVLFLVCDHFSWQDSTSFWFHLFFC